MSDGSTGDSASDGSRELVVPLETARGQKSAISGKVCTRLDPKTREKIVDVFAEMLVARRRLRTRGSGEGLSLDHTVL
jgi:hypothetical protein